MIEYWASFAKTGVPTDSSQGIKWPKFERQIDSASPMVPYLFFGYDPPRANSDMRSDLMMPTAQDCAMWESFIGHKAPAHVVFV